MLLFLMKLSLTPLKRNSITGVFKRDFSEPFFQQSFEEMNRKFFYSLFSRDGPDGIGLQISGLVLAKTPNIQPETNFHIRSDTRHLDE